MLIHIQDLKRKNYLDTLQIQEDLRNQVLKNDTDNHLILVEQKDIQKNFAIKIQCLEHVYAKMDALAK